MFEFGGDMNVFSKLAEEVNKAAVRAMNKGIMSAIADAKKECPVDTGRLRASITGAVSGGSTKEAKFKGEVVSSIKPPNSSINEITAVVGTDVVYGARVEYGYHGKDKLGRSINQRGRPFLMPAIKQANKSLGGFLKIEMDNIKLK